MSDIDGKEFDAGWTICPIATEDGVNLRIEYTGEGKPVVVELQLTREQGRAFAQGVLAACGDAYERTFPAPHHAVHKS